MGDNGRVMIEVLMEEVDTKKLEKHLKLIGVFDNSLDLKPPKFRIVQNLL
jgi:hypothetical protein